MEDDWPEHHDPAVCRLFEAVRRQPLKRIAELLEERPDAVTKLHTGTVALHEAIWHQRAWPVVRALLDAHPEAATFESPRGDSAMSLALRNGEAYSQVTLKLIDRFPHELRRANSGGDTALVLAIVYNVEAAVRRILRVFPSAARRRLAGSFSSSHAPLPLHVALRERAGDGIVRALLDANPQAVRAMAPIPQRVSDPDNDAFPLRMAIVSEPVSDKVVLQMIDMYPPAARALTAGETPVLTAIRCRRSAAVVRALLDAWPESARMHAPGSMGTPAGSVLHAALFHGCDSGVVHLLLRARPELASERDSRGGLALHHVGEGLSVAAFKQLLARTEARVRDPLLARDRDGRVPLARYVLRLRYGSLGACDGGDPEPRPVFRALLAACPKAAGVADHNGSLPLVEMLRGALCAADMVRGVLAAFPEACRTPCPATGQLPLHVAACHGAPREVVQLLLEANPGAAREPSASGDLPVFLAVSGGAPEGACLALLDAFPGAARPDHGAGACPVHERGAPLIHHACACAARRPRLLRELLRLNAGAAARRDRNGLTALAIAVGCRTTDPDAETALAVLRACPRSARLPDHGGRYALHHAVDPNKPTLPRVVDAVLAAYPLAAQRADARGQLPVHVYLSGDRAEDDVLAKLVEAFPGGMAKADAAGGLPLHGAVEVGAGAAVVSRMLALHPYAARVRSQTAAYRRAELPLHTALSVRAAPGVVRALLDAYPRAAHERDSHGSAIVEMAAVAAAQEGDADRLRLVASYGLPGRRRKLRAIAKAARRWGLPAVVEAAEELRDRPTPLHQLARLPPARVRFLLRRGDSIDHASRRSPGMTPLAIARGLEAEGLAGPGTSARLVLDASLPWTPETHSLFPPEQRREAVREYWIGKQLANVPGKGGTPRWGEEFMQAWMQWMQGHITRCTPHAVPWDGPAAAPLAGPSDEASDPETEAEDPPAEGPGDGDDESTQDNLLPPLQGIHDLPFLPPWALPLHPGGLPPLGVGMGGLHVVAVGAGGHGLGPADLADLPGMIPILQQALNIDLMLPGGSDDEEEEEEEEEGEETEDGSWV